jgi:hypothetical protein
MAKIQEVILITYFEGLMKCIPWQCGKEILLLSIFMAVLLQTYGII